MAEGKSYGRFSGRGGGASAYDIMAMAKRQGAEVIGLEAYYDFQEAVNAEARKAEMAQSKGALGGKLGGAISSYLTPIALGALGLGTGGLGNLALAAIAGAGMSYGGKGIGDVLARQWSMGGGLDWEGKNKLMSGNLKYKDFLKDGIGPYGGKFISDLGRKAMKGPGGYEEEVQDKIDYQDILRSDRLVSSILSGLVSAGQVSATAGDIAGGGVTTMVDGVSTPVSLDPTWWGGQKIPVSQYSSISQAKPSFGRGFEKSGQNIASILDWFAKRKETIKSYG